MGILLNYLSHPPIGPLCRAGLERPRSHKQNTSTKDETPEAYMLLLFYTTEYGHSKVASVNIPESIPKKHTKEFKYNRNVYKVMHIVMVEYYLFNIIQLP